jgi:hypothetical protein
MTQNLGASIVIAIGLVVASVLLGGIYDSHGSGDGALMWRVNRLTGRVETCVIVGYGTPAVTKFGLNPQCVQARE